MHAHVGSRSLVSSAVVAGQFPWALMCSSFKLTYIALGGQLGYRALVLSNAEIHLYPQVSWFSKLTCLFRFLILFSI